MLAGPVKRIFRGGPAGPAGATLASALTDVTAALKAFITAPDLASARTALGLTVGSSVQAWSATLDALAGLTTTAFGRSLLTQVDGPTALGTLGAAPAARQVMTAADSGLTGGGSLGSDLPLAIAANGVANAMLAQAPAYTLKANLLAGTANVQDVGLSALIDAMFGNTRGALLARSASGWGLIAPGTVGQYLGTGGPGADPSWGTPQGAGNVSALNNPTAGQFAVFGSSTSIVGLAQASFRNRLRNGNFAVNARGVSGTVNLAAGAYGHDGWKAGASGATYTFAASGPDTTITLTAGTLLQIVDAADVEGGAYVLSNAGTAQARVYQGAATGAYSAGPVAVAGLTAGTAASVEFSTGTISRAQFESGTIATAFERRKLALELAICGAYFRRIPVNDRRYYADGGGMPSTYTFAEMRGTPVATLSLSSAPGMASGYPTVAATSNTTFNVTGAAASTTGSVCQYIGTVNLSCEA